MSGSYLRGFGTRATPQSEPIPGSDQVENSAGGHAWDVGDWERLSRFLILGAEGGSYYAGEQRLVADNATAVLRCVQADGGRAVDTIVDISVGGRAPKNSPAIFALAIAAAHGDDRTRAAALDALPAVCRTGTHLFEFAGYVEQFRGWGRGLRRAVAGWYQREDVDALAYQLVKYRQRGGWTHGDLLRLAHPEPPTAAHAALYRWTLGKYQSGDGPLPAAVHAFNAAQRAPGPAETFEAIRRFGAALPREALQTEHLNDPVVWDALLDAGMPMTALIRNLATMTRVGLLTPTAAATQKVIEQLADRDRLRRARVHPVTVLAAMLTYASGRSARGAATWTPLGRIVDALDDAFYDAFDHLEPTGKRWLIGLDVSGSMDMGVVAGVPGLTPRIAAAAMAMTVMRAGDPYEVVAFTGGGGGGWYSRGTQRAEDLTVLPLSARQRLDDICGQVRGLPFGGTDCALPMLYATQKAREVDCFAVYTDSETWAGSVHPAQALREYRRANGIDARLVVVGMVANEFTIADPNDAGMLDVVGFDTAAPNVIADFARAERNGGSTS